MELDIDNLISFCPYCGGKLLVDPVAFRDVLVEKERTKRVEMEYEQEDKRRADASRRRLGRIKASVVLAAVGILMFLVGDFAGEASGNPNSAWYFMSLLGLFPLFGIPFIWMIGSDMDEKRGEGR